ncbi:MAG: type II secretion system protein [bacterium]
MKRKGFTLIELMIVVAIIGILLAMLLPRVGLLIDRSREKASGKNLKNIYAAIVEYSEKEHGKFVWPRGAQADSLDNVKDALTNQNYNPEGKSFDKIPYALLRRTLNTNTNLNIDSGEIYKANSRVWDSANDSRNKGGWMYVTIGTYTGEVFINCSEDDTFGNEYTTYMCW